VETAIGIFSLRGRAEETLRELLLKQIPEDSIVFLTRSETEANTVGKQFGAAVGAFTGGAVGISTGMVAATLLLPGVGSIFALGLGAAALLGLTGASVGASVGKAIAQDGSAMQPTPDSKCSEDVSFFRDVLLGGRSLIVVRTESRVLAQTASEILDRTGLAIKGSTPVPMQASVRAVEDVAIIELSGRITAGAGTLALRELVRSVIESGTKKILIDLHGVDYVDSSGLGELVGTYSSVRNQGGQVKLVSPSKRMQDLLQLTRLSMVFDVQADETSGIRSFQGSAKSQAVA
jgi:anti-sigma B factor antagonist